MGALTVVFVWLAACAPSVPIVRGPATGYEAAFIDGEVSGEPGAVVWSPDGNILAYLTRRSSEVTLYDAVSGERIPFEIDKPFFLSWADQLTLLVLHGDRENPLLTILDVSSKDTVKYPLPPNTVAVSGEPGLHHAWVFTQLHEWRMIGFEAHYGLYLADWEENILREITDNERIVSIKEKGAPFLRGWTTAGPDPVGGRAVLLQLISPPLAPAYLKVIAIDTILGEENELGRIPIDSVSTRASWSPDGSRLALAGADGLLKVLSLDGKLQTLNKEVAGKYPTWDPRGGQIFFGGFFISDDGSEATRLVRGSSKPDSAAFFSPSGERLALIVKRNLWLIKGVGPAPGALGVSPDVIKEKAAALRDFYREGLITKEDYKSHLELLIQELTEEQ